MNEKKEKDDFSVSDTGGSEEKIRLPHSIERLHCDVCWLVGARMVAMVTSKGMLCFKLMRLVFRKARKLFGPEGKFYCQDQLNSSTVPSSQTSQFCFVD